MGGSLASKPCGLGPAGFPQGLRSVAATAVSLYGPAAVSPATGLDCHLDRTLILARPLSNSLGIFFDNTPFPSLFCRRGFNSHRPRHLLAGVRRGLSGPWPTAASATPTQGRLRCTQHLTMFRYRMQVFTAPQPHRSRWRDRRMCRPPRKEGRGPHAIAGRPHSGSAGPRRPGWLYPQHQPPIGHRRPAPETSSMCPLTDF